MRSLTIFTLLLGLLVMASCELQMSDNGDLDGYWQLKQLDSLGSGYSTDMRSSSVFWSVQKNLLQVSGYGQQVLFRFDHNGDSLFLSQPRFNERMNDDPALADSNLVSLRQLGINALEERFQVNELGQSTMVLQSATLRLHFRRY